MDRIQFLLSRYLADKASKEEIAEMLQWLRDHGHNEALLQQAWEVHSAASPSADLPSADLEKIWSQIALETLPVEMSAAARMERTAAGQTPVFRRYAWMAAAALVLLVAGAWLLLSRHQGPLLAKQASMPMQDIAPGKNGAMLILADGKQMVLDSLGNGVVAVQNGAKIILQNGQLSYNKASVHTAPDNAAGSGQLSLTYNTISTPRGRQFTLLLPDGSRVWLNAASTIRFPTQFAGNERRIELTGEAYFEVKKDKSKPFIVHTMNTETEVLGTSFNINAYPEDGVMKTTLLEGSIRTGTSTEKALLTPGEQVRLKPGEKLMVDRHADLDEVLAWKNGAFNFQNADLKAVMRQLARWYDLDVVYEKGVPDVKFGGEMSRNVPLSDLLKGLKDMDVHFRIEEGHKLIVMP